MNYPFVVTKNNKPKPSYSVDSKACIKLRGSPPANKNSPVKFHRGVSVLRVRIASW
jgi:hypothetical protein